MKIVSTTYEMCHGAYIYRLVEDSTGVIIKRTPSNNVVWTHGSICQILDVSGAFKQARAANPYKAKNIDDALTLIEGL